MNKHFLRSVHFKPWIGQNYEVPNYFGVRVLVLGESHYGVESPRSYDTTRVVVRNNGLREGSTTFTKLTKILANQTEDMPSAKTRSDVWQSLVFYNFIQEFVAPLGKPRVPPTKEMRKTAWEPFTEVLERCRPELLVLLGGIVKAEVLKASEQALLPLPKVCTLRHPAAALRYEEWCPVFQQHLQAIKE